MRDILADTNRQALAQVVSSDALLAFDYDGTLAPIVSDPEQAHMRARTRHPLERVARAYPCIVISGRSRQDVQRRLSGIGVFEIIGNHGLEPRWPDASHATQVRAWLSALEHRLGGMSGVAIEDKRFSLAIHYRGSRNHRKARLAILRAAADLKDVRLIGGKSVINLVPREAPHKGTALAAARETLRCDTALYVGDDETDEDVFALGDPVRLLTIRVGRKRTSRADFYVSDQNSIDFLLATLLRLREPWRRR